jgi:hypothetical protein
LASRRSLAVRVCSFIKRSAVQRGTAICSGTSASRFIHAVDLHVGLPHMLDSRPQTFIADGANRARCRIMKLRGMASARRDNPQDPVDRLDSEGVTKLID